MEMTPRQTRWLKRIFTILQAMLCLAIVLGAIQIVSSKPIAVNPLAVTTRPTTTQAVAETLHPLDWYEPIWKRNLKQPPFEPKMFVVAPEPIAPPPLPAPSFRLLGTVVGPNDRHGLFTDGGGHVLIRRVDEVIDGYQVTAIERGKAEVRNETQSLWLKMPDYEKRFGGP